MENFIAGAFRAFGAGKIQELSPKTWKSKLSPQFQVTAEVAVTGTRYLALDDRDMIPIPSGYGHVPVSLIPCPQRCQGQF